MTRERLCSIQDLPSGQPRRFDLGDVPICVVHIAGQIFAIGDTCSHANVSLSEGEVLVDDCEIECWKHGSSFSLATGEPLTLPATLPVPTYAVFVDGADVYIDVDEEAQA
jgi:3-phenylpropionate/trans-cinnamate dioxygenase ferredoxin component